MLLCQDRLPQTWRLGSQAIAPAWSSLSRAVMPKAWTAPITPQASLVCSRLPLASRAGGPACVPVPCPDSLWPGSVSEMPAPPLSAARSCETTAVHIHSVSPSWTRQLGRWNQPAQLASQSATANAYTSSARPCSSRHARSAIPACGKTATQAKLPLHPCESHSYAISPPCIEWPCLPCLLGPALHSIQTVGSNCRHIGSYRLFAIVRDASFASCASLDGSYLPSPLFIAPIFDQRGENAYKGQMARPLQTPSGPFPSPLTFTEPKLITFLLPAGSLSPAGSASGLCAAARRVLTSTWST